MKKIFVNWLIALKAKTPKGALRLRNACAFIVIAIPALEGSAVSNSAPAWYNGVKWYIMSVSLMVGLIAQSQKKEDNDTTK